MAKQTETTLSTTQIAGELRPSILRLGRQLRREAIRVGSSALDAQLLGTLMLYPGMGVSDLAALEQMTSPAMSAHVKRLLASGYVQRETPTEGNDQRHSGLLVTARGHQHLKEVSQRRDDWLAERIQELSPDERKLLIRAIEPLKAMLASGDAQE